MCSKSIIYLLLLSFVKGDYVKLNLKPEEKESIYEDNYLFKRGNDYYDLPLKKSPMNYQLEIKVGSTLQPITVFIDSGSSDIVIQDITNNECDGSVFDFAIPEISWLGYSPAPKETKTKSSSIFSSSNGEEGNFFYTKQEGIKELLLKNNIKIESGNEYNNMNLTTASDVKSDIINCDLTGQFNSNESTTFQDLHLPYRSSYLDKNVYLGKYVKDHISIGDVTLEGQQFGLVNTSTNGAGSILGLGYKNLEAGVSYGLPEYPNFVQSLKDQGKIGVASYSIDLNKDSPSILFGAVDMNAVKNETILKVQMIDKVEMGEFSVKVNYIAAELNSFGFEKENPDLIGSTRATFDTGSGLSVLTSDMYKSILDRYPFDALPNELYIIHKSDIGQDSIYFNFNGYDIGVQLKDYFTLVNYLNGTESDYYLFDASPKSMSGEDYVLLGQDIIRNLYVVVDFEKNELGLAELDYDSSRGSKIVTIGSDGIPNSIEGSGSPYKPSKDSILKWNIASSNPFSAWHWVLKYLTL